MVENSRVGSSEDRSGGDPEGARVGTAVPPLLPGYEVLAPLGAGATSAVWRARRRADGLVVAVKVLRPAGGDVAAGLQEAGLLARVRHRHVVHLYDVLPLPDPATGRPAAVALATQLAGGGSLAQVLARRRILSAGELVTALQPVAGALADLHGAGVVHGDLSTGNVLFLRDGMPVLGDLGAARITGEAPGQNVGTGAADGMVAPEVVEGFAPTPESDVYQLGALAWRCLAGEPPGPPYDRGELAELAPDLPSGLADLVLRAMAPDPEARPDAEEVALALLACTTPEPVEVAPDADPAHGLTERLRSEARADLDEVPTAGGRRGRLLQGRPRAARRRGGLVQKGRPREAQPEGARSRAGRGTHRRQREPGGSRQVALPAALALASVLLVAAAVAVVRPQLVEAGAPAPVVRPHPVDAGVTPPHESSDGGEVGPPRAPASGSSGAPAPDLPDTGEEVADTLQRLLDGRGEAWEQADDGLLAGVVAPGSPAEASESEQLARLRESGVRYPDVTFRVEDAAVEDAAAAGADATEDDRLRVRATVSRAALDGRDRQGQRIEAVPVSSERVSIELARVRDRWLLWSWRPVAEG